MDNFEIITLTYGELKRKINAIATLSWGGDTVVVRRELFSFAEMPCITAVGEDGEPLGYCYYRIDGSGFEIMGIESLRKNIGVGTAMMSAALELARTSDCKRFYLVTTNDNTRALRFYQKFGMSICAVRLNEIERSRELKPGIPPTGNDGIPIMHEIELEFKLL